MEILLQKWYHVLGVHALQHSNFALRGFVGDLLLVASQERIGQWDLARVEQTIALLFSAIGAPASVEFDTIDEGVNLADLGLSSSHFAYRAIIGCVANVEVAGEWVTIQCIPLCKGCQPGEWQGESQTCSNSLLVCHVCNVVTCCE